MNRKIIIFILLTFIFTQYPFAQSGQRVVVIDAGHGGKDPGTIGKSSKEKNITLKVAKKVGSYITANMPGTKVIYTRTTDVFIPLEKRAEIANRNKADLFISIHGNSSNSKSVYGTEIYHFPQAYTLKTDLQDVMEDSLAKKENRVVTGEKNYRERYLQLYKMTRAKNGKDYEQSVRLAKIMDYELNKKAGRRSRGIRSAKYLVIGLTEMPAVLIEIGYLSNPNEERFMASEEGQSLIASSIYRGVKTYLNGKITEPLLAEAKPQSSAKEPTSRPVASAAKPETKAKSGTMSVTKPAPEKTAPAGKYKVQLGVFSKKIPVTESKWKQVKNLKIENVDNKYYYFDFGFPTKEEAEKAKNMLRKNGFPDAFVLPKT
ncbi:MAG: N-acetylmuramoyl-L-alanine amidase [Bacteroidia bacterium]|nr:N-acetylmuramoyl-L-alanine amidase [Bacteroidia bacterium]